MPIQYNTPGKRDLIASIIDSAGNISEYDYDSNTGYLILEKNSLDHHTYYEYNSLGLPTKIWGASQYPVSYEYDQFGQKISMQTYSNNENWENVVWPNSIIGNKTTWTYDVPSGLIIAETDANNKSKSYTYTLNGKLASRTWARGIITNYTYDRSSGNLQKVEYSDDTPDITFAYNRLGQFDTIHDATGIHKFTYNSTLDEQTEIITGIYDKILNRTYTTGTSKGKVESLKIGNVVNYLYEYDDYGRIAQIQTPAGNFIYNRLPNSDLISTIIRPNNTSTSLSYETNRNKINQISTKNIFSITYTNNSLGNRIKEVCNTADEQPISLIYSYNNRNEITQVVSDNRLSYDFSYNFDWSGNRLQSENNGIVINYSTNSLNQYVQIGSQLPIYDDDGNMLQRDGWVQIWNAENRLKETSNFQRRITFTYDYLGRRIEKKVYVLGASNAWILESSRRFVYDGYKQIEELDGINDNAPISLYVWQPKNLGNDHPLLMHLRNENKNYFYLSDINKNIMGIIDDAGSLVAQYTYSPFGELITKNDSLERTNPFGFSSEYYDLETKLIYYNFRYYSPKIGRWINQDPIREIGGNNLYRFVSNNPINYFDEYGLACCGDKKMKSDECCHKGKTMKTGGDIGGAGGDCCVNLVKICLTKSGNHQNIEIGGSAYSYGLSSRWSALLLPQFWNSAEVYIPDNGEEVECYKVKRSVAASLNASMAQTVGQKGHYGLTNWGEHGSNCRSYSQTHYNAFRNNEYKGDLPECDDDDNSDSSQPGSSKSSSGSGPSSTSS